MTRLEILRKPMLPGSRGMEVGPWRNPVEYHFRFARWNQALFLADQHRPTRAFENPGHTRSTWPGGLRRTPRSELCRRIEDEAAAVTGHCLRLEKELAATRAELAEAKALIVRLDDSRANG